MVPADNTPIPAALLQPWLDDNAKFIDDIARRNEVMAALPARRAEFDIREVVICEPVSLAAVDAAVMRISLGDMLHLLIQAIRVTDDGETTLGAVVRASGVDGHEMRQAATPLRIAEECALLAAADSTTIADTSFWSLLMEVNQAITLREHHSHPHLVEAVDRLTTQGLFLRAISNDRIIAMSKRGEAKTVDRHVSDREAFGRILRAGEFVQPKPISEALQGNFGIEKRGFNNDEREQIRVIYEKWLGVTYYKPHEWSRAYRIEGHLELLNSQRHLFPILSAVHYQTTVRSIIEPWPQFLADYTAKQISHVALLYGDHNYHRSPFQYPRTKHVR